MLLSTATYIRLFQPSQNQVLQKKICINTSLQEFVGKLVYNISANLTLSVTLI